MFSQRCKRNNQYCRFKSLNLPIMENILESNDIHMSWFAEKLINLKEINQLDSIILIEQRLKKILMILEIHQLY